MDNKISRENGHNCHANKHIIPTDAPQWVINLIELRNHTGITYKQIAESENLSEKSVSNVFLCKAKNPGVDLVRRIIHALGGSWRDIFGESDAVIGSQDLATLQVEVDRLTARKKVLSNNIERLKDSLKQSMIVLDKKKFKGLYSEYISFALHTGDYCGSNQEIFRDFYKEGIESKRPILNCIGNHDMLDENSKLAKKSRTYEKIFSTADTWDVSFADIEYPPLTDANERYG